MIHLVCEMMKLVQLHEKYWMSVVGAYFVSYFTWKMVLVLNFGIDVILILGKQIRMKPQFPRIKLTRSTGSRKLQTLVAREKYNEKMKQIEDAVKYCKENNCRGKQALSTGRFPLIKDHKTIT